MNTEQLELRQLRVLVALVEEGTFTDAAIRVGLSQSAVSRSIARLEAVVGVRLVERTTRTVALTVAGAGFYREVAALLRQLDGAVTTARGEVRPLRLGYTWAAFGRHTSPILRDWRAQHADVPLEVHRVEDRTAGVARGVVDVAVTRVRIDEPAIHTELLTHERRVVALPAGHPLAHRADVALRDLIGETVAITPSVGTTTLDLWPADARPSGVLEVDNIDEWLLAIASGVAVGVTPESTPSQHANSGVVFVPLAGVVPVAVYLVWPAVSPHPSVAAFAGLVRAHVEPASN